jgi:hypothetical protein
MRALTLLAATGVIAPVAAAAPIVIDFESYHDASALENGRQLSTVAGLFEQGLFTISSSADNQNGGGRAAIFDSDPNGPNASGGDPDLLVDLGNIVIVQNDGGSFLDQAVTPGVYDTADDDAQAGQIVFGFTGALALDSIDLVDINGNAALTVTLEDTLGLTRIYAVPSKWTKDISVDGPDGFDTLLLSTLADQDGEGSSGPATASQDAGFNQNQVVSLTIDFTGSAGIDNLVIVPAPGVAVIGLAGLAAVRRRR